MQLLRSRTARNFSHRSRRADKQLCCVVWPSRVVRRIPRHPHQIARLAHHWPRHNYQVNTFNYRYLHCSFNAGLRRNNVDCIQRCMLHDNVLVKVQAADEVLGSSTKLAFLTDRPARHTTYLPALLYLCIKRKLLWTFVQFNITFARLPT